MAIKEEVEVVQEWQIDTYKPTEIWYDNMICQLSIFYLLNVACVHTENRQTHGQTNSHVSRQKNKHCSMKEDSDLEQEFIKLKCSTRPPSAYNIHCHEIDNLP